MISRFFLVGIVAALGITIPTWTEIRAWMGSLHQWTATALATLDTSTFREDHPEMLVGRVEPIRPVFVPIVPDDHTSSVADELNRMAEGLDPPPHMVVVRRAPAAGERKGSAMGRVRPEYAGVVTVDAIDWKLMSELLEAVDRFRAGAASAESPISRRHSEPAAPPIVCVFSPSTKVTPARSEDPSPGDASPIPIRVAREPDLIAPVTDESSDVAGALNRFAEGIGTGTPDSIAASTNRSLSGPIEGETNAQLVVAEEVERIFEGLPFADQTPAVERTSVLISIAPRPTPADLRPATAEQPSPGSSSPEVAHAIRLTHDAVRAWMRVMSGPGFVRISSR